VSVSVRVLPGREVKGRAWAERFPDKAGEPWLVAVAQGRRKRWRVGPDTPEAWAQAEREADELRRELEGQSDPMRGLAPPTLAQAIDDFLRYGLTSHKPSTRDQRRRQLGRLKADLGNVRLDRLTSAAVTCWWTANVRTYRTGDGYLNALSGCIAWAHIKGLEVPDPVPAARAQLKRLYRTAATRALDEENCRPLTREQLVGLARELAGARADVRVFTLLCLDAGLRLGEAEALRWRDCNFGKDPADTSRHLHVRESKDASGRVTSTKSGRSRRVAMSRRLRQALLEFKLLRGRARPDVRVLPSRSERTWRMKLRAITERAGIDRELRPKDLRDTFASQLVSANVPLAWVSRQLGHGNIAVTARHYAAWVSGEDYFGSPPLEPGEVPPDLLTRPATTAPPRATTARKTER